MDNSKTKKLISYIKTDDSMIVNEASIRWVQKMDECLEICTKSDGCKAGVNTHRVCKLYNPNSYSKLIMHFAE